MKTFYATLIWFCLGNLFKERKNSESNYSNRLSEAQKVAASKEKSTTKTKLDIYLVSKCELWRVPDDEVENMCVQWRTFDEGVAATWSSTKSPASSSVGELIPELLGLGWSTT